ADLSKHIMYVALANLILCPLVFLWQLMFLFFNYGEMIKREPGTLGARAWSQYARLYLRHFNELDHELNARLTRAYRPAVRYISAFSSPLMTVIARNIAFIAGGVLATLLILTVYDEDVLAVEHVLSIMTILGAVVATCRLFIPDENLVWCPEQLLAGVLAHVHYLPASWRGYAHTTSVRDSFSQLFQYKAVYLFYELISPLTTPFILLFWLRPKALDIVDFYRNFTVAVVGVGDVCSFAQMDVRKHGNPDWQTSSPNESQVDYGGHAKPTVNQYTQGEHGKTELSLLHFALTNPDWAMPHEAHRFVSGLRRGAMHELRNVNGNQGTMNLGAMGFSLNTLSSLGEEYASIANSILVSNYKLPGTNNLYAPGFKLSEIQPDTSMVTPAFNTSMLRRGLNRVEGNIGGNSSLLLNLQCNNSLGASVFGQGNTISRPLSNTGNPLESNIADMSLSTLYLHEMHHRQLKRRVGWNEQRPSNIWSQSQNLSSDIQNTSLRNQPSTSTQRTVECEKMPLLSAKKSYMEQYINNIIVIESVVKDKTLLRIIYRRDATLRKTELNFYSFQHLLLSGPPHLCVWCPKPRHLKQRATLTTGRMRQLTHPILMRAPFRALIALASSISQKAARCPLDVTLVKFTRRISSFVVKSRMSALRTSFSVETPSRSRISIVVSGVSDFTVPMFSVAALIAAAKAALSSDLGLISSNTPPFLVCLMDFMSTPVSVGFTFSLISLRMSAYVRPSAG
ncbi:autophagy-related protein 9A-like, partial [Ctenocephalides felis]|uniref:autophagy-related protein 9A-like n=1 Tax=Ctenocephalides felis TaxID=7515 RepID=UPI000E6E50AF